MPYPIGRILAALALVARARQRPDLSPEDMERLRREFNLLLERLRKRDLPRG